MQIKIPMTGFAIQPVTDTCHLYGWNADKGFLYSLMVAVANGKSFFLQGERRSGKTSVLNCLKKEILAKMPDTIPVLIDCQNLPGIGQPGMDNAYRYILSEIAKNIMVHCATGPQPWLSPTDILARDLSLLDLEHYDKIPTGVFITVLEALELVFKQHKKSLLLIFDEYEYFAKFSPEDNKNSFSPIRSRQQHYSKECGGIFCIIAGAENLDSFMERTGSSQFNLFSKHETIPLLSRESFNQMWDDCCGQCNDIARENLKSSGLDFTEMYTLCGGRASFAKLIGESLSLNPEKNDLQEILGRWFSEILYRQSKAAQEALLAIASGKAIRIDSTVKYLEKMFLIEKDDPEIGGFKICGTLWQRFLAHNVLASANPEIRHAGDLARQIVERNLVGNLLKMREGEGEKADWLEFKAVLIPPSEKIEEDSKKEGKQYGNDDYIWQCCLKPLLQMRCSRGGLVLLGVADNGHVIGLENNTDKPNEDFKRLFLEKVGSRSRFTLHDRLIDLSEFDWDITDLSSNNWMGVDTVQIDNKLILAIWVYPCPSLQGKFIIDMEKNKEHPRSSKYILVRKKIASSAQIHDKDVENLKRHFQEMQRIETADLLKTWEEILAI